MPTNILVLEVVNVFSAISTYGVQEYIFALQNQFNLDPSLMKISSVMVYFIGVL
jgi:hypothetical protein